MSNVQLSPERLGRITGSRISKVLGLAPASHGNRTSVLREMVRQYHGLPDEFEGNEATDYGQLHEPDAIHEYEQEYHVRVHGAQSFAVHPFYDFLGHSPDGLIGDDGMLEAKAPFRARYLHINQRRDHEAQLRLGLDCTGRKWCDYVVWRPGGITVSRIDFDPTWLPRVMPKLLEFMDDYIAAINDPEVLAREQGRGKAVEASDREALLADAARWRELQQLEDATLEEIGLIKGRIGLQLGSYDIAAVDGKPIARWQERAGSNTFDRASFKRDHPDLESDYSTTGEPTRFPVLINKSEGEVA